MASAGLPRNWFDIRVAVVLVALGVVLGRSLAPTTLDAAPAADGSASPAVVVIEGDRVGDGGEKAQHDAAQYCDVICQALRVAGLPFSRTKDSLVEQSGVPQAKVAILPYNRAVSDAEAAQLLQFIAAGGKVVVCYLGRDDLLQAIRVQACNPVDPKYRGEFSYMLFEKGLLFGTPSRVAQQSWVVRQAGALPGGRVLATWADSASDPRDLPAVIVSDTGAYVSHVLTSSDLQNKAAFLRALIGYWAPEVWRTYVPTNPAAYGPIGRFATLSDLIAALGKSVRSAPHLRDALGEANSALAGMTRATVMVAQGQYAAAAQLAHEAKVAAQRSYWRLYPSPPHELRGVWATNEGLPTWDTQMQELARANVNAVYPYRCTGGVAFYRSTVLPNAPCVREHGDYLADAVAAGRKWGVPVHARMLNLSTMFAPPEVKEQLKAQGRLMLDKHGSAVGWLCPSNAQNRAMECAAAREMVTRYAIAGIQFDYLRYPEADCCFCPRCLAKFEHDTGARVSKWPEDALHGSLAPQFADWRREQVTGIAREVAHAARVARPGVTVSASVFLNWADHRNEFGQDWKAWVDEGIVDYVCPMNYTANLDKFTRWLQRQMGWVGGKVPVCAGIGPFADGSAFTGPQQVLDEIEVARNMGAGGFVIFNYQPELARDYLPYLALGATSAPSTFAVRPRGSIGE